MAKKIIFDLDGTLVDSSIGILASLTHTFKTAGIEPATPLDSSLIGPPLRHTVTSLAPNFATSVIDLLIKEFQIHYDTVGYKLTVPFLGVEQMLSDLQIQKCILSVATNKRHIPTQLILSHLGWSRKFIYADSLDSQTPAALTKTELLARLLSRSGWHPSQCLYVGDREEDYTAAQANCISFAHAQWGYGQLLMTSVEVPPLLLEHPSSVLLLYQPNSCSLSINNG
jgi:phosphoglycolate phosphatase